MTAGAPTALAITVVITRAMIATTQVFSCGLKDIECSDGRMQNEYEFVFYLGSLQNHKWENCMTVDRGAWTYRRDANLADFLTMDDLTKVLAETIR